MDDQELQGSFNGKLAERIGLEDKATKDAFFKLCENVNPVSGKQLTPRTKTERTVGYDINFHCPKSVSLVHVLSKDDHILQAFHKSVSETMRDMEADAKTRVRKNGSHEDRETGELAWAEFIHQTARPVGDNVPDPHLHCHAYVFNATWDEKEQKIKAGKFQDIMRDIPYYHARFQKRLSDNLISLGYQIRLTNKSWELAGVPQEAIDLFSKRTDEIGRVAKEKGITDAKALDKLGAKTRSKKQKGLSMSELKAEWKRQLKELETNGTGTQNKAIRFAPKKIQEKLADQDCINYALKHNFERASVMRDRKILTTAYKYALGNSSVSLDGITQEFKKDDRIIHVKEKGKTLCTTREVLAEERNMVDLAKRGKNKLVPLYEKTPSLKAKDQQAAAITHVLTTKDRVSIIRGVAGSGKTTLMQEAIELMEAKGKTVTVVAPTAQASRGVLKDEGFEKADTVARILADKNMQETLYNQVLWVDEAGLLGTKDMSALLKLATEKNARLILGGDTRQHSAVVRGDALRILNTVGGIDTAEVNKIHRQKNVDYKMIVESLANGDVKSGIDKLDRIGAINTVDPTDPNSALVEDYVNAIKKGKSAIVISPTHKQGEHVTIAIREKLRAAKLIGKSEIEAKSLNNLNMTAAQKSDWRSFEIGQVICFNQHNTGIKKGSQWAVKAIEDRQIQLANDKDEIVFLPRHRSDSYDVFKETKIGLSKGDKVQITRNGMDADKKRLNNGMSLEVRGVGKDGKVILQNNLSKAVYTVDKGFGHLTHAHCITSHASQGKTVDQVFISQPSSTFAATDAKQFYVSVSRGRESVKIYTDDKAALIESASELGDRQSALEVVADKKSHIDYVQDDVRFDYDHPSKDRDISKDIVLDQYQDIDYEPEI